MNKRKLKIRKIITSVGLFTVIFGANNGDIYARYSSKNQASFRRGVLNDIKVLYSENHFNKKLKANVGDIHFVSNAKDIKSKETKGY